MKIKLLSIGKTTEKYLQDGIKIYTDRLRHYARFEMTELPEIKAGSNMKPHILQKKEAELILKHINHEDFVILLDKKGKSFDSLAFSKFIESKNSSSIKSLLFVIGGAYGFTKIIHEKADMKIALSNMTFTHQMVRLFFVEQLFRAFTIIHNHPYHND